MARTKKRGAVKLELYSLGRKAKPVLKGFGGTLRVTLLSHGWPWAAPDGAVVKMVVADGWRETVVSMTALEDGIYRAELGSAEGTAKVTARFNGIVLEWPAFEVQREECQESF